MKRIITCVLLLLAAACTRSEASNATTTAPASTTATTAVQESSTSTTVTLPPTTTLITTTTTQPAIPLEPSTALEPIGVIATDPLTLEDLSAAGLPDLDGYQNVVVAASGEYGSYAIAVPDGWLWWVLGEDPTDIVEIASEKDLAFSRIVNQALTQSNDRIDTGDGQIASYRGQFIDPNTAFYVSGTVALNDGTDLDLDNLVEFQRDQLTELGAEILRLEQFPAVGGGSVESTARFDLPSQGWEDVMIQHQSFIYDEQNEWLWGVVCTVHESGAAQSDELCWTMIRSFVPFGPLVDGGR